LYEENPTSPWKWYFIFFDSTGVWT
jgi:hypothetical protein